MEKGLRYLASGLGLALIALVMVFAVGEGMPNLLTLPPAVRTEFAAMGAMLVGMLVALKWSRIGGGIILAVYALFQGVEWRENHRVFPFLLVFAAVGLLHLLRPTPGGIPNPESSG